MSNEESKMAAKASDSFNFVKDLDNESMEISMVIDEGRKSHQEENK